MKMVSRLLLLTAALADLVPAVAARHRSEAPASKALELLEKLWSQGQAELNDEALRFEKLKQWCADTAASKKSEIQDGEEKEERTSAVVESTEAAVAAVQEDIEDLVAKASKLDEKRSHTEKRRQDESTTYITSDEELQKSIRAVQRASFLLREKNDAESKAAAASELQTAPRDTALAALQVEDPGFAASSILEMLTKLSERFHAELEDLRKAETQAKQEHELLLNQLEMEHEGMEAALRTKRSALGDAQRAQTEAGEDLEDARKDLQQDKKYLEDLHVMCSLKAESFKKRRSSRQAELEALKAAVGLIRDKVSGLVQLRRGSSLVALRGEVRRAFQALRSGGLEALATRLAGKPLAKVRQMIMETINNLEEASREEGEKQAFCSKELAASRAAQTAAKDAAAELRGELEEAAAEVQQLTEDEAALRLDVEKLGRAAEEAQKERTESKTRNDASIKEAEESQQALEKAMVMLREVYGKAPASLLQVDQTSTSSAA